MVEWNSENAAHLLRRAGFAADPKDVKKALKDGQAKTVKKLFVSDDSPYKLSEQDANEGTWKLQYLWLKRMATTSSPLIEKLTLFWHNHFATAVSKVEDRRLMFNHVRTLRKYGLKSFRDMVLEVSRDPAMIIWLDNRTNTKDSPNENYARELMELFTTGVLDQTGAANYTEQDVVESARAFTGWTIEWKSKKFVFDESEHDFGSKTFRGQTGDFDGTDIVDMLVVDPATARRIPQKLWSFFAHDIELTDPLLDELAQVYLDNDTKIKPLLEYMFRHDAFYSASAKQARIKSPVELLINMTQLLKAKPNGGVGWAFADLANDMGQELYNPPTVFGWKEGLPWVGTNGMLERARAAERLTSGRDKDDVVKFSPKKILGPKKKYKKYDPTKTVEVVLERLGLTDVLPASTFDALVAYMLADHQGNPIPVEEFKLDDETLDRKVRGLCAVAMALPEFQRH